MRTIPKNIRQIGAREDRVKIYMEDYVGTYLKRIRQLQEETGVAGWLIGEWKTEADLPDNLFVSGAVKVEDGGFDGGGPSFTEAAWNEGYEILGTYFSGQRLCGIFVCEGSCRRFRRQALFAMVRECFGDESALLYILTEDGEEVVYRIRSGSEERLQGYYCYFERNEAMQDYMMDHLPERRVEWETPQTVRRAEPISGKEGAFEDPAQGGKQRLLRRKEGRRQGEHLRAGRARKARVQTAYSQADHSRDIRSQEVRNSGPGVAMLCAVMAVVIFVSGMGLVYREQGSVRMKDVLSRLGIDPQTWLAVSAQPEETGEHYVGREQITNDREGVSVIVEEIPGNVYPTEEETGESQVPETQPSETQPPETQPLETQSQETQSPETQPQESQPQESQSPDPETTKEEETTAVLGELPSLPAGAGVVYTVQAGDSLYSISRRFYGTDEMVWVIQQMNSLENPDRIKVGQELLLP